MIVSDLPYSSDVYRAALLTQSFPFQSSSPSHSSRLGLHSVVVVAAFVI